jgi:hypothetical protein
LRYAVQGEGFLVIGLAFLLEWLEPILCLAGLVMIVRSRQLGPYRFLAALLGVRFLSDCVLFTLLVCHKSLHLTAQQAYDAYFYIYWGSDAIEAVLGFGIILSIYRLAMEPLEGLQRLGMIMFRWAGFISVGVALSIAVGPHITSSSFITRSVGQLQQTQSVLTLCMLVFVCFAIHPMGLSFRSRIFGVCLGLGIMAATDLVTAAWIAHSPDLYSISSTIGGIAVAVSLSIWSVYFILPEPARRMIMVPTTSPFFHWNEISKALGDAPGFVAVGPVTLDNFAPAELEIMRRASDKMEEALSA